MKTILIVEDNLMNMKLLEDLLQAKGYAVEKSFDGSDVLEIARRTPLDLIILDIQLPRRSGLEIAKDLKAADDLKNIPILAVTVLAMEGDEERVLSAGCDGYMTKPISVPLFYEAVEKFLL